MIDRPRAGSVSTGTRWQAFFFRPQTTSPMALVRIAWGFIAALWALTLLPDVDPFFVDDALRYERRLPAGSWNPLEWVPWDRAALVACLLLVVSGLATMVGWRTRLSAAVSVVCLIALQRDNPTILNAGDLVVRQVGIAVALAPCGVLLSLDARRRARQGDDEVVLRAPWAMRLLQLELAIGYALSAWAKTRGTTWHEGTALGFALRVDDLRRFPVPEVVFDQSIVLNVLTWATLAFEASFILLVWNRRLRPWVLGVGVVFHLGIDAFLDVGFFSLAMLAAYLAFVPGDVADRIVARLDRSAERLRPRIG